MRIDPQSLYEYSYSLDAGEDQDGSILFLSILRHYPLPGPEKEEEQISGIYEMGMEGDDGWQMVFTAAYCLGSAIVRIPLAEEGSLEHWLTEIDAGRVKSIHEDRQWDRKEVHKAFPMVLDIYSMTAFTELFKGWISDHTLFSPEIAEKCFTLQPDSGRMNSLSGDQVRIDTHIWEVGEDLALEVLYSFYHGRRTVRFLVSEFYVYAPEPVDLRFLFTREQLVWGENVAADLARFGDCYSHFGLKSYLGFGGRNIAVPLLAENFHKGIELLAKAGCVGAVGLMDYPLLHKPMGSYHNVNELTGVPISVARKVTKEVLEVFPNLFARLEQVWNYAPRYLNMANYTVKYMRFLDYFNVTREEGRYDMIDDYTDDQVYSILHYLTTDKAWSYILYRDYLRICMELGRYPDGLTPKNLKEAHDRANEELECSQNEELADAFCASVESYREYATDGSESDNVFDGDAYCICLPKGPSDLVNESAALHHCVRTYVQAVALRRTRIVFLRRKECPEIPYATIEVVDRTVLQVKGVNNTRVCGEAQQFVRKWARQKRLNVHTEDMDAA